MIGLICIFTFLQLNKEKSQALVEFLTPQDATAALSYDGRSISGSVLKIRRPKDFVETAVRLLIIHIPAISCLQLLVWVNYNPHNYCEEY